MTACVLFLSSLQSLNEVLSSGSKEENKAAVEKQVKELFLCSASGLKPETIRSQHISQWSTNMLLLFPQVQEVNAQLQKEREAEIQARQAARSSEQASGGAGGGKGWNEEDLQLLIKAVNLFPAGTNAR